jgi:hypothetical protein
VFHEVWEGLSGPRVQPCEAVTWKDGQDPYPCRSECSWIREQVSGLGRMLICVPCHLEALSVA